MEVEKLAHIESIDCIQLANKVNKHKFSPSSSPEGLCYMKSWEAFQNLKALLTAHITTAVEWKRTLNFIANHRLPFIKRLLSLDWCVHFWLVRNISYCSVVILSFYSLNYSVEEHAYATLFMKWDFFFLNKNFNLEMPLIVSLFLSRPACKRCIAFH